MKITREDLKKNVFRTYGSRKNTSSKNDRRRI